MKFVLFLFLGLSSFFGVVKADNWSKQSQLVQFPFEMELDMEKVYALTHGRPSDLVSLIQSWGIRVYVVAHSQKEVLPQPYLVNISYASEAQKSAAQWQPSYFGRALGPILNLGFSEPTILIREDAHPQVLIHETLHLMFKYSNKSPRVGIDELYNRKSRRLDFFQRKIIENPINLLNPLWRRDILEAKSELLELLYERVQFGQAQEAIIELVLAKYIDKQSPYYDQNRLHDGIRYAEQNINNAISVYNHLDFILNVNNRTVQDLYFSLERKDLQLLDPVREALDQGNVEQFNITTTQLISELQPVKQQILALRTNYTMTIAKLGLGADLNLAMTR